MFNTKKLEDVSKKTLKATKSAAKTGARVGKASIVDATMSIKDAKKDAIKKGNQISSKKDKALKIFDLKSFLAPDGADPEQTNHFTIVDNGIEFYTRSFYVSNLPKRGKFAEVFDQLFQFKNCNSTVYIDPVTISDAIEKLDNDLTTIEAEIMTAKDDTNRRRKMQGKYSEAEFFQRTLEGRDNKLFRVAFIFTLMERSVDELDRRTSEFVYKGKDSGIELVSFYANHEKAFKLNKPFNIVGVSSLVDNFLVGLKWHQMDLYSLSTIYAHTSTEFYHENGLVIGRNILTGGYPVAYDIHDKSHSNQNIFVAGTSGYGKSSTVKKLIRLFNTMCDQRFVVLDTEVIKGRGEFSDIVDELGGYRFDFQPNSTNVLNPFEINVEEVYSVESGNYEKTLKLAEKIPYTTSIILSLISNHEETIHSNTMVRCVKDIVSELFRNIGLVEGDASSLYFTDSSVEDGKIITTNKKKALPTITEFFIKAVIEKLNNHEPTKRLEYLNLIDGLSNFVRDLRICEHGCGKVFTSEEFEAKEGLCDCKHKISIIQGSFSSFDGQTSSDVDLTLENFPIISVDVSNVPKDYLPKAMMVGLNFIMESIIKRNSENPQKAMKVALINDEQHKTFRQAVNRAMITEAVRIVRKRNAGLWSITQSVNDYTLYEECKAIVTQSDTAFIFRHKRADYDALKMLLDNVNESDLNFIMNASKGEVFIRDVAGNARCKIDLLPIEMRYSNSNLELEKR